MLSNTVFGLRIDPVVWQLAVGPKRTHTPTLNGEQRPEIPQRDETVLLRSETVLFLSVTGSSRHIWRFSGQNSDPQAEKGASGQSQFSSAEKRCFSSLIPSSADQKPCPSCRSAYPSGQKRCLSDIGLTVL